MKFNNNLPIDEEQCLALLLESCAEDWKPAEVVIVIVNVMEKMYLATGNTGSDMALEEKLRYLYSMGKVEIDFPDMPYGKYKVRLADTLLIKKTRQV